MEPFRIAVPDDDLVDLRERLAAPAGRRRRFVDIRHWNELDRGGRFSTWEQLALFVEEVRAFCRLVR